MTFKYHYLLLTSKGIGKINICPGRAKAPLLEGGHFPLLFRGQQGLEAKLPPFLREFPCLVGHRESVILFSSGVHKLNL